MANKLFVGSLPYATTEDELRTLFSSVGEVVSVKVIVDRATGRSKGFAFVEMKDDATAKEAVEKLNGYTVGNRQIVVNEARPLEERPRRSFDGNR